MDFSAVCRFCLSTKNLTHIFDTNFDSATLCLTTGLKVKINDGLPQHICSHCTSFVNESLCFRNTCKANETKLLAEINQMSNNGVELSYLDENPSVPPEDDMKVETLDFEEEEEVITKSDLKMDVVKVTSGIKGNTCHQLSTESLYDHMVRRRPCREREKDLCDLCGKCLVKDKLQNHKMVAHGVGLILKCQTCKGSFKSKQILEEHISTCKPERTRGVCESNKELTECDVCHKTMQKASLKTHKAVKHAGLGPVCVHCGRMFSNTHRLNEHYRAKHGYEKFKCSHCDYENASRLALRNHERKHKGEKPFVCELCGAKFHAPYLLVQHKQSHRTEKTIKCDLCPASFKTNNTLHMHKMQIHSKKLFKCTLCTRVYSCRSYTVKHIRQVHRFTGPVPALQCVPKGVEREDTETGVVDLGEQGIEIDGQVSVT